MHMATISRHWRGLCRADQAAAYVEHLRNETFPAVQAMPGFLESAILQRQLPQGVEFIVITVWASLDAIKAFAGDKVESAVVPEKVKAMMVEFDPAARHYEMLY
jgi:heme-degrading monooxygenase HmoA